MLFLTLLSIGGLIAGLLLLRTVPIVTANSDRVPHPRPTVLPSDRPGSPASGLCSLGWSVGYRAKAGPPSSTSPTIPTIIIPARNEALNLPPLLKSVRNSAFPPTQILVVDDGSTDSTAAIATQHGATVIASSPLPAGWTGKTWACHQGALAASSEALFFLDADTFFTPTGYARIVEHFAALPPNTALSILPFHRTQRWYEELSLFFNILVAMGAGGFGKLDPPHLFGQSLLIPRSLYNHADGHHAVKGEILENLHFASHIRAVKGIPATLSGRNTLEMRMFPEGIAQLRESWQKAFSTGAGVTSPLVLGLSIYWLAAAMLTALLLPAIHTPTLAALYLLNALQIAWYARQLGTFRTITALLYPIPLAFYFATFAQSLLRQQRRQPVTWRGREV